MFRDIVEISDPLLPIRDDHILETYAALAHLKVYYPDFHDWYWDKVVPELGVTRRLDIVRRNGDIAGICISKKDDEERKICSIWVTPKYRGTGLGVRMIIEAMTWLETTLPVITIPEERYSSFNEIFQRLGFPPPRAIPDLYRSGCIEYIYNCDQPTYRRVM